ncbi:MAG: hypothetical protein H0X44_02625 [Acidobacteria bacterium]|nr:hypothetical protein [Acidobacteriota bacterium]
MLSLGQILLTIGTLIVVVPARDAVVIVADSKTSRRTSAGQGVGAAAGTAFFVTGISPVAWVPDDGGVATVVDARGLVTARLSRAGRVTREAFDAVADESARLSAHEVASFVVRLTATGADGTVGPPFRAYLLSGRLAELPPVAPCR